MSKSPDMPVPIDEILTSTFDEIETVLKQEKLPLVTFTGYLALDTITGGLAPGNLILLAGRPSMGKSSFCNCIADHVGLVEHKPVLMFSLDTPRGHRVRNMLCSRARVDLLRVRHGDLGDGDVEKLTRAAGEMMDARFHFDDSPGLTIEQLCGKARMVRQEHDLGLVIVDYVQLLEVERPGKRFEDIDYIARQLKSLAREIDAPIVAASQLGRTVDSREDKRPRLADLRDSGALEDAADLVCFLYRETQYRPSPDNTHRAEMIVAKQRCGPVGIVPLHFFGNILRFENPAFEDTP